MTGLMIACACLILMMALSLAANHRFSNRARLPMQFNFAGAVTWSAPRALALAFTPVLAALVFSLTLALGVEHHPQGLTQLSVLAAMFLAAHIFHLVLIDRNRA